LPEIIAEIGQNHNGDMGLARELIHAAKDCGADIAKFQVYDARALFPREGNPWFDYNCKTEISRDQLNYLVDECRQAGIEFMASAFDPERVRWLDDVGVKTHKIASRSVEDRDLIGAMTARGKRLLVSLGMWKGVGLPHIESDGPVQFLYCISKYPTPLSDVKLAEVDFKTYGGFSDHTIGVTAACAAMARGARIIEKHFTLDKGAYGPDHECSMTPDELTAIHEFRRDLDACL
jgi:N-acetylneuraminate synthase/N,N'-diacetyllegionaminate synthase